MEREANLLRCAKLNCYAEFNSMVHAIARHGGDDGDCFQRSLSKTKMIEGSSTEYFFYTTLVSMLNQVIRNSNSVSQQVELQQIYQWFCTNKPLIAKKTNPKHQRPKLSLSTRPVTDVSCQRPHTAPTTSVLQTASSPSSSNIPPRPCTTDHTHRRSLHGFTSNYMSNSLSLTQSDTASPVSTIIPRCNITSAEKTVPRPNSRSGWLCSSSSSCNVSVIELPSDSSGHLNMSTLLHLAPSVAANMEWQREMNQHLVASHRMSITPQLVDDSREMTISSSRQNTPAATVQHPESPTTPQTPSLSNTLHATKPPIHGRLQSPVHVLTLDIPPTTTTTRRRRNIPTPLKRTGSKAGSGFKCSRYRSGSSH